MESMDFLDYTVDAFISTRLLTDRFTVDNISQVISITHVLSHAPVVISPTRERYRGYKNHENNDSYAL